MVWVYIALDILILMAIIALGAVFVWLWNRRSEIHKSALSQFRNDDLYKKSLQDQQKLAHIEDVVSDFDDDDIITDMDETDRDIRYGDVEFSDGYGVKETEYEEDEEE